MQVILKLTCPDRPGIVAAVSRFIYESGGNIREAHQFDDAETKLFFMRVVVEYVGAPDIESLRVSFTSIANEYAMEWEMRDRSAKQRVLLLVSKFDHCLADILYRWRAGELRMDIVGIVSNHPLESFARLEFHGLPFDHLEITKDTKAQQEDRILSLIEQRGADLIILARYMQILSDELSSKLEGRCINIHHSFLPGFKGARPYHQAHERGVKLIGATAHYVTADLDEGPIIEQDVERISHHDGIDDLVLKGRDIERRVLSQAVALHLDGRVIINGRKTVVFRG